MVRRRRDAPVTWVLIPLWVTSIKTPLLLNVQGSDSQILSLQGDFSNEQGNGQLTLHDLEENKEYTVFTWR